MAVTHNPGDSTTEKVATEEDIVKKVYCNGLRSWKDRWYKRIFVSMLNFGLWRCVGLYTMKESLDGQMLDFPGVELVSVLD